eukprot:CAMPEP_0198494922 /NCGR_PEP_ID=MMETSP1462-20131121/4893_1 /TAXON_ID=1333877 /ORGANISM="Brandtodinium nutriculum, Strain RCC3387" /LENGTH=48 /DNA_ID= /DNA_START= /DNA_END= /DNA_ORIENTATION=
MVQLGVSMEPVRHWLPKLYAVAPGRTSLSAGSLTFGRIVKTGAFDDPS